MVLGSSLLIKRPPAGYLPEGYTPPAASADGTGANVHVDTVLKTPQFWLLFTTSTLLATGNIFNFKLKAYYGYNLNHKLYSIF